MVVNFSLDQKVSILNSMIDKTIAYTGFISSGHGRTVSLTVTGVSVDEHNSNYITLHHDLTFEDNTRHAYVTNGDTFLEYYLDDIKNCLDVDLFWLCARDGVSPLLMNYADLKAETSWMIAHDFKGKLIFETYARAMLCWYEKNNANSWAA